MSVRMASTHALPGINEEGMNLDESFMDGPDALAMKENICDEQDSTRRRSMLKRFTAKLDPRRHSVAGKASAKTLAGRNSPSVSSLTGAAHPRRGRSSKKGKRGDLQELVRTYYGTPPRQDLQTDWAAQASPTVLRRLGETEQKRQEACFEITNGEEQYVEGLEHIDTVFSKTLLANKYLTPAEHASIFSNLPDILSRHKELNVLLKKKRHKAGITVIGKVFLEWWRSWEPAEVYGVYCSNLAYGKHVLREVLEKYKANKNSDLEKYLKRATELKQSQRQMLHDLLDAPRRRLQNYGLLLKAVRKYTSPSDPDSAYLDEVMQMVTNTCAEVDRIVRDTGRDRVVAIQESIDFSHSLQQINLVDDNVPLLLEGDAFLKDGKPCKIYLFQHMFFVLKESKHNVGKYVIVNKPIQMTHLEIEVSPRTSSFKGKSKIDEDELECFLTIRNCDPHLMKGSIKRGLPKLQRAPSFMGKAQIIKFANKAERAEWVDAIETLKKEQTGESVITFV